MKLLNGALLTLFGAAAAFAALEADASRGDSEPQADVLLVLGCRVRGEEAEPTLRMRAETAAQWLNAHSAAICIPCGGIVHADQTKSEAEAIREILLENGVEEERIFLEDRSQTTLENFLNAKALLENLGLPAQRIAFVSSEFHLFRARQIAKIAGLNAQTVAAPSPKNLKLKNYLREALVFPLLAGEIHKTKEKTT